MIKDNQRRMINSLLEKLFKKVVIDKLLIDEGESKELFNELEEVLKKTAEYLKSSSKRKTSNKKKSLIALKKFISL